MLTDYEETSSLSSSSSASSHAMYTPEQTGGPVYTRKRKFSAPQRSRDDETSAARRSKNHTDNPYADTAANMDTNLRSLVDDYSLSKPCLRTVSYAFPKMPWLTNFMLDDALLATSLSTSIRDNVPEAVMDLAGFLDDWERNKVYRVNEGTDSTMCYFRRLGVENQNAVRPGAHDFGLLAPLFTHKSVIQTHKILFIYRALDVLAWISDATEVHRSRVIAKSPEINELVTSAFRGLPALTDWVASLNETARACLPRSTSARLDKIPAIDWDHLQVSIPSRDRAASTLKDFGRDSDFRVGSHAAICNIKTAAFALCYLLDGRLLVVRLDCHEHGDNLSHVNLMDLKETYNLDVNVSRCAWETLALALFVSPVLLLCGKDITTMRTATSIKRLWELWVKLGNTDRPAALVKTEKQVWKIILDVARGHKASDCIASFAEYWLDGARNQQEYKRVSSWFASGPQDSGDSASGLLTQNNTRRRSEQHPGPSTPGAVEAERPAKRQKTGSVAGPSRVLAPAGASTPSSASKDSRPAHAQNLLLPQGPSSCAMGKINHMKQQIQEAHERIAGLERENKVLTQEKEKADDGVFVLQSNILGRLTKLLRGHPEEHDVTDVPGALAALQQVITRLSNASTSKEKELERTQQELKQIHAELGITE